MKSGRSGACHTASTLTDSINRGDEMAQPSLPENTPKQNKRSKQSHAPWVMDSPEYSTYLAAKKRCNNPKDTAYVRYGGRGIEFRFESFEEFFAAIGPKPSPKHSIDRINNDGHYEAGNVRWATDNEQRMNTRRTRFLTLHGVTRSLQEWAQLLGVNPRRLYSRLFRDWCHECTLTTPNIAGVKGASCPHDPKMS